MLWMRVFLTGHPTLTERWKEDFSCRQVTASLFAVDLS